MPAPPETKTSIKEEEEKEMSAQNTTVIITGAGGGLGKATATFFLAAGANVAICDVNQDRLTATEQEWTAAGHPAEKFLTTILDVTDEGQVQAFVAATAAKFGRVDVLINNAGIMDDFSPVGECSKELWDRVLGVNLHGPYHTSRAAIAQFEKQKQQQPDAGAGAGAGGVIINICSVAALRGDYAGAAYTASKHGLLGLTRNTAASYADKGIYSVALVLGGMPTNIADSMAKGFHVETFQRQQTEHPLVPEKHLLQLDNVAKYCLFLSDKGIARSANGSTVNFTNNWPAA